MLLLVTLCGVPLSQAQEAPGAGQAPERPAGSETGEGGEEQAGAFFETLHVKVVNVDVHVTDKRGNRITGLTAEDFEVYEDGRRMEITNFFALEGGAPIAVDGAGAVAPPTPAGPPRAPDAGPEVPEEQRLHLVVYIDNFNIRPFNRNRVFHRLREFLSENLRRGDRVMLASYDRSLHVRRGFTGDPGVVISALYELETFSGHGVHQDSDRRDILEAIEEAESIAEVAGRVRTYAESLFNDLSFTISALQDFVSTLAGLPGRKALLYVSDGVPMTAAEDIYLALQQRFQTASVMNEARSYDASRRYRELAAQANANRVAFYTIDAGGLRVHSSATVQSQTPGLGTLIDSTHVSNIQSPLHYLADKTGGLAIVNTNDVGPGLERVARDFDTYYSLGYRPGHSGAGRYHSIEVKVKRKGLRVRHREGYRDKTPEAEMADGTLSILHFGIESNPMGVRLVVGEPQRREDGLFEVPMRVVIPLDRVVLVPHGELHEARLRLFLAAVDEQGDTSPVQETQIPIQIPSDEVERAVQQGWLHEVKLLMRGGQHRVAVGLRDDFGASASFVERSFFVGA